MIVLARQRAGVGRGIIRGTRSAPASAAAPGMQRPGFTRKAHIEVLRHRKCRPCGPLSDAPIRARVGASFAEAAAAALAAGISALISIYYLRVW
jgi:hypothetical protein